MNSAKDKMQASKRKATRQRDNWKAEALRLRQINMTAQYAFFAEGTDGEIAANMLLILQQAEIDN